MNYRARSLLAGNHYLTFASLYALFCSEFSAKGDLPALVYVHPGVEISIPLCMNIEGLRYKKNGEPTSTTPFGNCSEPQKCTRDEKSHLAIQTNVIPATRSTCSTRIPWLTPNKNCEESFLLEFVFPPVWYYATFLYFGKYYRRDPRERAGLAASPITLTCILYIQMMHSKFNIPPGHTRKDSPYHGSTESGMNPNTKESTILRFSHKYILVKKIADGTSQ
ncbi:unnamed protein product [Brassica oleracea]